MSDDLISRKAVMEEVKRYRDAEYSNNDRTSRALSYVVEIIKNQPTAFNKKKVMEELSELQEHTKTCENQCEFASAEYFDYMGAGVAYKTAIEIVERGGIE